MPHDSFKVSNQARAAIEEILMYEDRNGATPEDVLLVRSALSAPESAERGDELATFLRRNKYLEALNRLLGGFSISDDTIILPSEMKGEWTAWKVGNLLLYERSPLLQGIPPEKLSTPLKVVEALLDIRQSVVEEQREVRGVDANELENYALETLAEALALNDRIPCSPSTAVRLAYGRDLYDRSPILQGIRDEDIATPRKLVAKLAKLLPAIAREQNRYKRENGINRKNGNNGKKSNGYSLSTLMWAIASTGKLKGSVRAYVQAATSRDLYDCSEILRGIDSSCLATPYKLVETLRRLRPDIVAEQRRLQGPRGKKSNGYSIGFLVNAIASAVELPGSERMYVQTASAFDLYDRSPLLQSIRGPALGSPVKLAKRLLSILPRIVEEQRNLRERNGQAKDPTIIKMAEALVAAGRTSGSPQRYVRVAGDLERYERSRILQGLGEFSSMTELFARLGELRGEIALEQRQIRGVAEEELPNYSLLSLVGSLGIGKGWSEARLDTYKRRATAFDIYHLSPTFQSIPSAALKDNRSILRFLLANRDRIAAECLKARGKLGLGEVLSPAVADHFAPSTLIGSLHAVGAIDKRMAEGLIGNWAGPLEYFMNRIDAVGPEVLSLIQNEITRSPLDHVDLALFTRISDPDKLLGTGYVRKILRMGRWFLTDPKIVTKSIYDAHELAILARAPHFTPNRSDLVPEDISRRLDEAARRADDDPYGARREVVEAMKGIVSYYEGSEDPEARRYLEGVERIVDWNNDALGLTQGALMASAAATLPMGASV